eukprot:Colp12_sorted_trinity150504_noHs@572
MASNDVLPVLSDAQKPIVLDYVRQKVREIDPNSDEMLPDYIMVMLGNRKGRESVVQDLELFMSDRAEKFVTGLWSFVEDLFAKEKAKEERKAEPTKRDRSRSPARPKEVSSVVVKRTTPKRVSESEHGMGRAALKAATEATASVRQEVKSSKTGESNSSSEQKPKIVSTSFREKKTSTAKVTPISADLPSSEEQEKATLVTSTGAKIQLVEWTDEDEKRARDSMDPLAGPGKPVVASKNKTIIPGQPPMFPPMGANARPMMGQQQQMGMGGPMGMGPGPRPPMFGNQMRPQFGFPPQQMQMGPGMGMGRMGPGMGPGMGGQMRPGYNAPFQQGGFEMHQNAGPRVPVHERLGAPVPERASVHERLGPKIESKAPVSEAPKSSGLKRPHVAEPSEEAS